MRYRPLETVREYARGRLAKAEETAAARDRHLDYFLGLIEDAEPELHADTDAWRLRLEAEHDNLREALEWGLAAHDPERGRRLAAGLAWLWQLHGHAREGFAFLRRAIARDPDARSLVQARLLAGSRDCRRHSGPAGSRVRHGAEGGLSLPPSTVISDCSRCAFSSRPSVSSTPISTPPGS